jgi:hypothetical protein
MSKKVIYAALGAMLFAVRFRAGAQQPTNAYGIERKGGR